METRLSHLKTLFPDADLKSLNAAASNSITSDEAVEKFLTNNSPLPTGTLNAICEVGNSNTNQHKKFKSFSELLDDYRKIIENDTYTLKVNRDELWRVALGFYKKALNNPKLLWKSFEVHLFISIFIF